MRTGNRNEGTVDRNKSSFEIPSMPPSPPPTHIPPPSLPASPIPPPSLLASPIPQPSLPASPSPPKSPIFPSRRRPSQLKKRVSSVSRLPPKFPRELIVPGPSTTRQLRRKR